ncbi:hypothetical protein PMI15_03109 [Polaromonas sp. CF318]|uniref:DUF4124 domain-containing protein n=1 Tax=Polaromonas sp. CF318 TaxID=1144318 RepID=UPI000270F25D|nr:DUF4124 domain-containing protein [Polaromonas sp. CF318]EJL82502.1 hypothetical protein PMI15_03109 [Polaromonas sp. CF318]
MRHRFLPALAACLLGLLFMQPATAQVYQCLDANGKKVFSQMPCATQGGSEKLIMQAPARSAAPPVPADGLPSANAAAPKDWAAENAAADARAAAAEAAAGASRQGTSPALGGLRKGAAPAPLTDKQIIANCEANRGARCSSANEIAQRRMEQRELTASERQQQQSAVAARRQREQDEAFYRSTRR